MEWNRKLRITKKKIEFDRAVRTPSQPMAGHHFYDKISGSIFSDDTNFSRLVESWVVAVALQFASQLQ
jgi:hypothetical protein